ncbi:MAG: hypothetical protein M1827_003863 [Pycnora praestabilis]|nr:MAG: hypothetical protein M1827_003863 [Pycnora praestabilis]
MDQPALSYLLGLQHYIPYSTSPTRRSPRPTAMRSNAFSPCLLVSLAICVLISPIHAVFLNFENCLPPGVVQSTPLELQFVPLFFQANFNTTDPSHDLNVTVYGNISGQDTVGSYPAPDDPQWSNPNDTFGKIVDLSASNNKYTTLTSVFNVLSYTPYSAPPSRFCNSTVQGKCPLGPVFDANLSDPSNLPAFSIAHKFYSSYAFTTFAANLTIISGDANRATLACVSANITPDIGGNISNLLTYLPLVILILVGVATGCAAIFSPWGTTDTFRWTSNYGRDADLLRLVTPGFGDCLQYLQFVVLTGGLSLNYPGYYQPVISQVSWSALMFNESFVSHGNGTQTLIDGIYAVNATYGLDRLSQLVGMTSVKDIWAGTVIWLVVIVVAVIALIQVGFLLRWGYRHLSNIQEEDLRSKNFNFTTGNVIRIVFNYFLLPLVALSMFQLVVAGGSAKITVGMAVALLALLIVFAGWFLYKIASTKPRSFLFDDLPTVLLCGPLYNTYSDDAATFALIPILLTFMRGIAIGAVQPSGIAQLVLLAICEVILILTLHAFRPFHSPTSMNAYHTFFAIVRLLTTLLSVAFVPSLGVHESTKGWIGYVILLMHAIVLVFGFFLNAIQTFVEIGARLAGAGGEEGVGGGAARGGLVKVFGMRQLSRRLPRHQGGARHSGVSDAAFLGNGSDQKSTGGRTRSFSGSSTILLNRQPASDGRASMGLDSISAMGGGHNHNGSGSAPYTPTTPGATSAFSYVPNANGNDGSPTPGAILGIKTAEAADPYYRPPRARRQTLENNSPGARSRGSWASGDWANKRWSQNSPDQAEAPDPVEGPSVSGRGTPIPAYLGAHREYSDSNANDPRRSDTDYAVREVDFYYRFRGPALSNLPTRRLGTGPADPTGPVASAAGWLKGLFGGKSKEKGKGFEVVRSSRAPPSMSPQAISGHDVANRDVPYHDNTEEAAMETAYGLHTVGRGNPQGLNESEVPGNRASSPSNTNEEDLSTSDSDDEDFEMRRASQISQFPPSLPSIDTGGGIELPSRIGSKASSNPSRRSTRRRPPTLPRKSSRRASSGGRMTSPEDKTRLSAIGPSPPSSPEAPHHRTFEPNRPTQHRLQPSTASSSRLPFGSEPSSARLSEGAESTTSSMLPRLGEEEHAEAISQSGSHARHSSSALGSLAPDMRTDRPTSVGYVQQHRASDNIHTATAADESRLGSTAEVIDDPRRSSVSTERKLAS